MKRPPMALRTAGESGARAALIARVARLLVLDGSTSAAVEIEMDEAGGPGVLHCGVDTSAPDRAIAGGRANERPILASVDVMMLGYLAAVALLLGLGADRWDVLWHTCAPIAVCAAAIVGAAVFARRAARAPSALRSHVYRGVLVAVVVENYLMLRNVLPAVRQDAVDLQLLALDRWLFGESPAIALQGLNHRPVVEWFAFFYFSYFAICAIYVVTQMWFEDDPVHTNRFAIGSLTVLSLGQLGYMLVPAFGPLRALTAEFDAPVAGGFWWGMVTRAVEAGSAMKDVFPSLHTALPLWFAGYAVTRAMRSRRWRIPAALTSFFSANIIFSTMLLRWHYAIDVIAGVLLAVLALALSGYMARRAAAEDRQLGWGPAWSFEAP